MASEAATEFTVPKLTRATRVWRACVLAAASVIQLATASPAAAVPGLYLVISPPSVLDSSATKTAAAYCRPGDRVIGGGGWVDDSNTNQVRLIALWPTKSATGDYCAATGDEPYPGFDGAWKVTAAAVCALNSSVPGHEIAYSPYVLSSATFQSRAARCPSGRRVLGTGALVLGGDHHVGLQLNRASAPLDISRATAREDEYRYDENCLLFSAASVSPIGQFADGTISPGDASFSPACDRGNDGWVHGPGGGGLIDGRPVWLRSIKLNTSLHWVSVQMTGDLPPNIGVFAGAVCAPWAASGRRAARQRAIHVAPPHQPVLD